MPNLQDLPNLGPVIVKELQNVGINTEEELKHIGSVEALILITGTTYADGCLNKLYALEGAIAGIRWHNLPQEIKTQKRDAYYARINKK